MPPVYNTFFSTRGLIDFEIINFDYFSSPVTSRIIQKEKAGRARKNREAQNKLACINSEICKIKPSRSQQARYNYSIKSTINSPFTSDGKSLELRHVISIKIAKSKHSSATLEDIALINELYQQFLQPPQSIWSQLESINDSIDTKNNETSRQCIKIQTRFTPKPKPHKAPIPLPDNSLLEKHIAKCYKIFLKLLSKFPWSSSSIVMSSILFHHNFTIPLGKVPLKLLCLWTIPYPYSLSIYLISALGISFFVNNTKLIIESNLNANPSSFFSCLLLLGFSTIIKIYSFIFVDYIVFFEKKGAYPKNTENNFSSFILSLFLLYWGIIHFLGIALAKILSLYQD